VQPPNFCGIDDQFSQDGYFHGLDPVLLKCACVMKISVLSQLQICIEQEDNAYFCNSEDQVNFSFLRVLFSQDYRSESSVTPSPSITLNASLGKSVFILL